MSLIDCSSIIFSSVASGLSIITRGLTARLSTGIRGVPTAASRVVVELHLSIVAFDNCCAASASAFAAVTSAAALAAASAASRAVASATALMRETRCTASAAASLVFASCASANCASLVRLSTLYISSYSIEP